MAKRPSQKIHKALADLSRALRRIDAPSMVIGGIAVTQVGVITRDKDILLVHPNQLRSKLSPLGWEHFQKHSPDK